MKCKCECVLSPTAHSTHTLSACGDLAAGASVVAFEALPHRSWLLERSASANNVSDAVRVVRAAAMASPGDVIVGGSELLPTGPVVHSMAVACAQGACSLAVSHAARTPLAVFDSTTCEQTSAHRLTVSCAQILASVR